MEGVDKKLFQRYLAWSVILIMLVVSFFIIRNYLVALISGFILAYLMLPLFKKISKKAGKNVSALICLILVLMIIIIPASIAIAGVSNQAYIFLKTDGLGSLIENIQAKHFVGLDTGDFSSQILSFLLKLIPSFIYFLPSLIISLVVTLFAFYFMLVGWDRLSVRLKEYIPFKDKNKVSKEISEITNSLVYGTFFIALLEFAVAAIGFYLIGVKLYFLLPFLIFIFAFIPGGPGIVWVPLAIYYFIIGDYGLAAGVVVVGLIVGFGIDAILRNKVLGDKAKINPLIMVIGVFGGVALFGIFGFIIGPLVLIYTIKLLHEEFSQG